MNYPYHNFYELIQKQAKSFGRKVAIFDGEKKIKYEEILYRADKIKLHSF